MNHILLINASTRGENSKSYALLKYLKGQIDTEYAEIITLINHNPQMLPRLFLKLDAAAHIVFAFPVYVDTVPALLQGLMEEYYRYLHPGKSRGRTHIYALTNCGLPHKEHCVSALKIVHNFALACGLNYQLGIGIGMGYFINSEVTVRDSNVVSNIYREVDKMADVINQNNRAGDKIILTEPNLSWLPQELLKQYYVHRIHKKVRAMLFKSNQKQSMRNRLVLQR